MHVDIPNIATLTFPERVRMPSCQADGMSDRRFIVMGVEERCRRADYKRSRAIDLGRHLETVGERPSGISSYDDAQRVHGLSRCGNRD